MSRVHEDALRRDADLAGMVVAALDHRLDDLVEVGAAVDDRRRGAAMLQRAARAGRQLAVQIPADPCRADEAQEGDARIGRQRSRRARCLRQEASGTTLRGGRPRATSATKSRQHSGVAAPA